MKLSSWTSSMKIGLMICSVSSVVLAMNTLLPVVTDLAETAVLCFQLYLKPPYIYLVVNFIIIAVAASSRLQISSFNSQNFSTKNYSYNLQPHNLPTAAFASVTHAVCDKDYILNTPLPMHTVVYGKQSGFRMDEKVAPNLTIEDKFIVSPLKSDIAEPARRTESIGEKPVYTAGVIRRQNSKSMSEDEIEALRTTSTETLESAWRKIVENRRIEKVDTWMDTSREMRNKNVESQRESIKSKTLKSKEKTFFDPRFSASARAHRMGVELPLASSLSQDELNRQVESFIRKFNEQMRLQREESGSLMTHTNV